MPHDEATRPPVVLQPMRTVVQHHRQRNMIGHRNKILSCLLSAVLAVSSPGLVEVQKQGYLVSYEYELRIGKNAARFLHLIK